MNTPYPTELMLSRKVDECMLLSVGLVNLKPVVPGHVLILSRRVAARFADLTADETADIWQLAKRVGTTLVG